tara:strand:+ start:336 stop:1061 length:726 start_codon:yes stop_codon:yes gene_type:complete
MQVSIVIPVYNEGENILLTLEEIDKIKKYAEITILICYDFDDDNTLSSINSSKYKNILNIIYVKNTGVSGPHAAVMAGIKYKKQFDYVIILPADDDYNIKNFPKVFEIIKKENPEIICMSRFIPGGNMENGPFVKTIIMRIVNFYFKFIGNLPTSDATNGFRIFSKKTVSNINIKTKKGFTYSLEYLIKGHKKGYKILEFPALWKERKKGQSRFKIGSWALEYLKLCLIAIIPNFISKKYF